MDRIFTSADRQLLISLLRISGDTFGNVPAMARAYKLAAKRLHPDKGGNEADMKKLNELWNKFKDEIYRMREFNISRDSSGPSTSSFRPSTGSFFFFKRRADLFADESLSSSSDEEPQPAQREQGARTNIHESASRTSFSTGSPGDSRGGDIPPDSGYGSFPFDSTPPGRTPPKRGRNRGFGTSPTSGGSQDEFERDSAEQNCSQATPPKSKKARNDSGPSDFPSDINIFLSNAVYSNKTVNAFLVFTTVEKCQLLYKQIDTKFKIDFKSRHEGENKAHGYLFILTVAKHRVSAIKNYCAKQCTVSFLHCKAINKPYECYKALSSDPYKRMEANKDLFETDFENENSQLVDWTLISAFAESTCIDDPYLIMGHYLDFASPLPCNKCQLKVLKVHYQFHEAHHKNAILFKNSKTQKTICQQAADVVIAKRRLHLVESSREELLAERFKLFLNKYKELDKMRVLEHMAGVMWYTVMFENIDKIVIQILKLMTENIPKKRNILFKGPINSGKTSFAAALLDLISGKTLNINCPADKLPFELGCALDQFAVVFEDVKGQAGNDKTLQCGQGVNNLDNIRDHLDGSVTVNLEKKHVNKKTQIFPPCIVTMNDYILPPTVKARFAYLVNFSHIKCLQQSLEKNDDIVKHRITHSGLTLFMLLMWYCSSSAFIPSLRESIEIEKKLLESICTLEIACLIKDNIKAGRDPLHDIVTDE
ncbi:large t antigen [Sorex minutus polyomavirus 1]|uniref:Large T antigen n=1 Tax=Sorex minutus polyomavirus 1 TaxID=2560771 RepID=A0A223PYP4_9POLY|nr:large t antigen [Sorex minutus polyomavirus 1]ASU50443.1 large t antigen [Sorex minutus polyomavirus 1]ATJ00064.1 large T antigen [Sorex minutus polyomavirus 1]ATJ00069.1 large T antigen [Sorex minutus polyomavirus 1]